MEAYQSSTSGPLLFCGFIMSICGWWVLFPAFETGLRKINPTLYHRLNSEARAKKLLPMLMMSLRLVLGVLISFPSCSYAAVTTPWGVGQPLSRAGEICVASQSTVWVTELGMMRDYSIELFAHHIICLMVSTNVVLSPPIHQIKLLYILFASQLGDLGTGTIVVLKMTGIRPASSKLMYRVVLASTCMIVTSKVGNGLWSVGNALQSPYGVADWAWTFCILFWAIYSLYSAYRNLKWLQIIKGNPLRPYSIIYFNRVTVPMSHIFLGVAFGATLLSTLFIYGMNHTHAFTSSDLTKLPLLGLLGVVLGLTSSMGMRVLYPVKATQTDPWGRDLYLHYGMLIVAWWTYSASNSTPDIGRSTIMGALALNVPLFQTIAKVSYYYSVKDAATHFLPPDPEDEDEKPIPVAPAMARLEKTATKAHLGMARANLTIFLIAVGLLACNVLNLSEAGTLALGASLVSQLIRSPGMIYDSLSDSTVAPFLHAVLTSVGVVIELSILVYEISARQLRADDASSLAITLDYALIGATILAGFASELLFAGKEKASRPASKTATPDDRPKKTKILSPMVFSILCVFILQSIMAREVIRYSGPQVLQDPGVGFKNFRDILTSPKVWAVVTAAGSMPVLLLKVMDFKAGRSQEEVAEFEPQGLKTL
ncbi:hypothetical protein G7Z17_g13262 [Cylindrodendrum hubeiense]|uniref:Uncharacterized protein n=1 Tax=Cylindrodendrum hubeiense TaxID=595255 RepID=A0A9P5GSK2_9HYPO|nr:hypothetical protein G7Z17_g13262 [Cylindrodendrum hubeiense]